MQSHAKECVGNSKTDRLFQKKDCSYQKGRIWGGGGGGVWTPPFPSGIRPPADPKGRPFDTFSEIHFWPTDPKIFLKAPLAPIYTNLEGERAPKKTQFFLSKVFKKRPKTAFLTVFSKIFLRRRNFYQNRGKTVLRESSKNQFGRPTKKKGRQNFRIFFKIRPPSRKS